jgi:hypothetical protein
MYTYRGQIFDPADTTLGQAYKVMGKPVTNDVELLGFLRAPGTLQASITGTSQQKDVGSGLQILSTPARPGAPTFGLSRGGRAVISITSASPIEAAPKFKDGLYGGGSSLRIGH